MEWDVCAEGLKIHRDTGGCFEDDTSVCWNDENWVSWASKTFLTLLLCSPILIIQFMRKDEEEGEAENWFYEKGFFFSNFRVFLFLYMHTNNHNPRNGVLLTKRSLLEIFVKYYNIQQRITARVNEWERAKERSQLNADSRLLNNLLSKFSDVDRYGQNVLAAYALCQYTIIYLGLQQSDKGCINKEKY